MGCLEPVHTTAADLVNFREIKLCHSVPSVIDSTLCMYQKEQQQQSLLMPRYFPSIRYFLFAERTNVGTVPMADISVTNPRENAGLFSRRILSWLNDTVKLGSKQPLDDSLLFPVGTFNKADRLMTELEREWLAEERATVHRGKKSLLWRAMMRTTSQRDYIILALLRLCDSLIFNALPFLI